MVNLCIRLMGTATNKNKQGKAKGEHDTTTTTMNTITKRAPMHHRSKSHDTILHNVEMPLLHSTTKKDTIEASPLASTSTVEDTPTALTCCVLSSSLHQRKRTRSISMPLVESSSRDLFFQPPMIVQEREVGDECSVGRKGISIGEHCLLCCPSSSPLENNNDDSTATVSLLEPVASTALATETRQQQLEQQQQQDKPSNDVGSSFPGSESSRNNATAEEEEEDKSSSSLPHLFNNNNRRQQDSDESSSLSESSSYSSSLVSFQNRFSRDGITSIRNSTTNRNQAGGGGTTAAVAAVATAAVDLGNTNGNIQHDDDGADLGSLGSLMDEIGLLIMETAATQPSRTSPTRLRPNHAAPTIKALSDLVDHEKWDRVLQLVQDYPDLCKSTMTICFQGEKIPCLILHCIVMQKSVPVNVVDAVVTVHPAALNQGDGQCGRLPLHFAILRGVSLAVLRYLCRAMPSTLAMPDANAEGNVALHYAVQYAYDDATIRLILEFSTSSISSSRSNVCALKNKRDRLVLHILCSRCCWEEGENSQGITIVQPTSADAGTSSTTSINSSSRQQFVISIETVRAIVQEYPEACSVADRNGRLPLHLYCEQRHPRWDVLQVLVQAYPAALLVKEHTRKMIPLQLLKEWQSKSCKSVKQHQQHQQQDDDNDVVKLYVQECTAKERRKRQHHIALANNILFMMKKLPLHVKSKRQQQQKTSSSSSPSQPPTILDLMNCYG